MLIQKQSEFAGELMLARDPWLVGGGAQGEDGFAADRRCGICAEESEERLPLECSCVGVFDWGRDGVEEGHGLRSVYWGRVK